MSPPDTKHYAARQRLRFIASQRPEVIVPSLEMVTLLDYIVELEAANYDAWENSMGEDL